MAKKKQSGVDVQLLLPVDVIAFYEGVAAYSRVSIGDVINIVLVMQMLKQGHLTLGKESAT
jgi:hypothetical protein